MYNTYFYEDINTYNIGNWSQAQVEASGSLVMADQLNPQTLVRSNRHLAKTQNTSWKSTSLSTSLANGNPLASVAFRAQFDNGTRPMGTLKASWYVTFRGVRIL